MTDRDSAYHDLRLERGDLFDGRDARAPALLGSGRLVYRDPYVLVLRDDVRFVDGAEGMYVRIASAHAGAQGSAVLPIIGDDIALLAHPRHATGRVHWEIPRGFAELGEDAHTAALREFHEETAFTPFQLTALGGLYPDTGLLSGYVHLFLAKMSAGAVPVCETSVVIRRFGVGAIEAMIAGGDIEDSFTLATFLRARLRGLI